MENPCDLNVLKFMKRLPVWYAPVDVSATTRPDFAYLDQVGARTAVRLCKLHDLEFDEACPGCGNCPRTFDVVFHEDRRTLYADVAR